LFLRVAPTSLAGDTLFARPARAGQDSFDCQAYFFFQHVKERFTHLSE
jgi:hypothetical protein